MEPDLAVHEDSTTGATEVNTLPANEASVPEEHSAKKAIVEYLLAEVEEFRELSRLRQEVSSFQ
jgi:hypothetical protein